ncbi:MAG: Stf0 family sulfotransferase [Caulobacteraceae bacterium]
MEKSPGSADSPQGGHSGAMTRVALLGEIAELRIRKHLSQQPWLLVSDPGFTQLFREWNIPASRLLPSDALDARPASGVSMLAIVCTEQAERPLQRKLEGRGLKTLGLFSQIVPRLAASLPPQYSASADEEPRLEYAMMCLGRSGSTLAAQELRQIGAGNPIEHFRGYLPPLLRERAVSRFDFPAWWELVRNGNRLDGVFATKIIFGFWKMAERHMTSPEKNIVLDFLRRVPIVYIRRSDKIGQAVSDVIARETGVWHLWNDTMLEEYQRKVATAEADVDKAILSYDQLTNSEQELRSLLDSLGCELIEVDYEALAAAPKTVIASVANRLGLRPPPEYANSRVALKATTSTAHEALRRRVEDALTARDRRAKRLD